MDSKFREEHLKNLGLIEPYIYYDGVDRDYVYRYVCMLSEQMNKTVEMAQELIKKY